MARNETSIMIALMALQAQTLIPARWKDLSATTAKIGSKINRASTIGRYLPANHSASWTTSLIVILVYRRKNKLSAMVKGHYGKRSVLRRRSRRCNVEGRKRETASGAEYQQRIRPPIPKLPVSECCLGPYGRQSKTRQTRCRARHLGSSSTRGLAECTGGLGSNRKSGSGKMMKLDISAARRPLVVTWRSRGIFVYFHKNK